MLLLNLWPLLHLVSAFFRGAPNFVCRFFWGLQCSAGLCFIFHLIHQHYYYDACTDTTKLYSATIQLYSFKRYNKIIMIIGPGNIYTIRAGMCETWETLPLLRYCVCVLGRYSLYVDAMVGLTGCDAWGWLLTHHRKHQTGALTHNVVNSRLLFTILWWWILWWLTSIVLWWSLLSDHHHHSPALSSCCCWWFLSAPLTGPRT